MLNNPTFPIMHLRYKPTDLVLVKCHNPMAKRVASEHKFWYTLRGWFCLAYNNYTSKEALWGLFCLKKMGSDNWVHFFRWGYYVTAPYIDTIGISVKPIHAAFGITSWITRASPTAIRASSSGTLHVGPAFFLSRLSGLMIELTIEIRTPQTPTAPAPTSQGSLPTQQTGLRTAALSSNIKLQTVFSISNHRPPAADGWLLSFCLRWTTCGLFDEPATNHWPLAATC